MQTFGYPHTLIREYKHWCVLLRPAQVTLGSLVLACKDEAQKFSDVSADAFAEQAEVVQDIERVLQQFVAFEKMNYMMLMMVDPDVHYPALAEPTATTPEQNAELVDHLKSIW